MACGTGKTYTSLKIAEMLAKNAQETVGKAGATLCMVPSLALMQQSVREWKGDAERDFLAFSACSDTKIGRISTKDDRIQTNLSDLEFPATTDPEKLAEEVSNAMEQSPETPLVVFSTYQSVEVISQAQRDHGMPGFGFIICDEAHRTTGSEDSLFTKIHDDNFVRGERRLYMTATPRIYIENKEEKKKGINTNREGRTTLASMDDTNLYGPEIFSLGFSDAVNRNLLSDYKVIVLKIDEGIVAKGTDRVLSEVGSDIRLNDAALMVGCRRALSGEDQGIPEMKTALAFCSGINDSKRFAKGFVEIVEEFAGRSGNPGDFRVESDHMDGSFNAEKRSRLLDWLRERDREPHTCRVLSNARCLSEGVDVPALDAVMFLHPRKSQIDVVQAVGRVMRKAAGKKSGYVILPVVVPSGVPDDLALSHKAGTKVIWQVLNALRSHDRRMEQEIAAMDIEGKFSSRFIVVDGTATVVSAPPGSGRASTKHPSGSVLTDDPNISKIKRSRPEEERSEQGTLDFGFAEGLRAKIVKKCGTRTYWEDWGKNIERVGQQHVARINAILLAKDTPARKAFESFLAEVRDDLNPQITEEDAVGMLAQHMITGPIFDLLFGRSGFTTGNNVCKAMERTLELLKMRNLETEIQALEGFYDSVRQRVEGIESLKGRQTLIKDLYERFFKNAFARTANMLGIVFTPVQTVDFMIHSVERILQKEFGRSLADPNVNILDPFTGTGTFITRLLQSGILGSSLQSKYCNEIHANEITLLAYYIACVNIESVFNELMQERDPGKALAWQEFSGAALTDSFNMFEQDRDMIANLLPDNSGRRTRQKRKPIRVIVGNPPWSAGQKRANDNAQNISYPNLEGRIRETYVKESSATLNRHLYDSYFKAFRWAGDRLHENGNTEGVIAFITNGSWLENNVAKGFRKCLLQEFDSVYVVNLRGNQRVPGEGGKAEGDSIFEIMTPCAITLLVWRKQKENSPPRQGRIFYWQMPDGLKRKDKLAILEKAAEDPDEIECREIFPDRKGNWVNQGNDNFDNHLPVETPKRKTAKAELVVESLPAVFSQYSAGIISGRNAFNTGFSRKEVAEKVESCLDFMRSEADRYAQSGKISPIRDFVRYDSSRISWDRKTLRDAQKGEIPEFHPESIRQTTYRPFNKRWHYCDLKFNNSLYQLPRAFPNSAISNPSILTPAKGNLGDFCVLAVDRMYDLHTFPAGTQGFPLNWHKKPTSSKAHLFPQTAIPTSAKNITDAVLQRFHQEFPKYKITPENVFHYTYGVLNSRQYREFYKNNLTKSLPRIPIPQNRDVFHEFAHKGQNLFQIHLDYENATPWRDCVLEGIEKLGAFTPPPPPP